MSRHPHSVSSRRLLLRVLSYHRGQTIAVALVTALITAGAVFAPWYTRMVDDTVTRDALAMGQPGSTLRLTGPDEAELRAMLPARLHEGELEWVRAFSSGGFRISE